MRLSENCFANLFFIKNSFAREFYPWSAFRDLVCCDSSEVLSLSLRVKISKLIRIFCLSLLTKKVSKILNWMSRRKFWLVLWDRRCSLFEKKSCVKKYYNRKLSCIPFSEIEPPCNIRNTKVRTFLCIRSPFRSIL